MGIRHVTEDGSTTEGALDHQALARRTSDGVDVSLLWTTIGSLLTVRVRDMRSGERFDLDVPRDRAMDAFRRPFAYRAETAARATYDLAAA